MKKLTITIISFVGLILGYGQIALANTLPKCTLDSNGHVTYNTTTDACFTEPDSYKITLYELYLCTAQPSAPTTGAALGTTNCSKVYDDTSGTLIDLSGASPSSNLNASNVTAPPHGTYTHGVAIVDTVIKYTDQLVFTSAQVGSNNIKGDSSSTGSGEYCSTVAGSSTSSTLICGSSATAAGERTEVIDDFGGMSFSATSLAITVDTVNNDSMTGYLITSTGELATNTSNADKIIGVVSFGSATTINASTTGMDVKFRKSQGMQVGGYALAPDHIVYASSGPFAVKIVVQ